ncbi:MAG: hypothetical protein V8Q84_09515 [Bilophila sp.]
MPCAAFILLLIHISILGLLLAVKTQAFEAFACELFLKKKQEKGTKKKRVWKKDGTLRREKQFLFEMVSKKIMV